MDCSNEVKVYLEAIDLWEAVKKDYDHACKSKCGPRKELQREKKTKAIACLFSTDSKLVNAANFKIKKNNERRMNN